MEAVRCWAVGAAWFGRHVQQRTDDRCRLAAPQVDVVPPEPQLLIAIEGRGVISPHVAEDAVAGMAALTVELYSDAVPGVAIVNDVCTAIGLASDLAFGPWQAVCLLD